MGLPGYQYGDNTLSDLDGLLASTSDVKMRGVQIDVTAADANSPLGAGHLRRGLLLGKLTATGLYVHFAAAAVDGSGVDADVVILAQNFDNTGATDPTQVAVVFEGAVHEDSVFGDLAGLVRADVQRLSIVSR